jgi:ADP-heptose:LPS heptosyltransferase
VSVPPGELARQVLETCHRKEAPPVEPFQRLIEQASSENTSIADAASVALFRDLVEPLSDAFEPDYCDIYAALFSRAIAATIREYSETGLLARYQRIRSPRRFPGEADNVRDVVVLSRVTLGADVAVSSLMLDAAKKRFPKARIHFAGSLKAYELFAGDERIRHIPLPYSRGGTLRQRLEAGRLLGARLREVGGIVIDPDSRLTQLGLLPVCEEDKYFFFESRSYGGSSGEPIGRLAQRWLAETFAVADARSFIAPACGPLYPDEDFVCVSLGVGENPAKRIRDPFEENLLRLLLERGANLLIDQGAGGEESGRVLDCLKRLGAPSSRVKTWRGAFAPFAATIAGARLYTGYDSSGQHVAATCGVPLLTVFAGFVTPRMFDRWHPSGDGPMEVIRVENPDPGFVLEQAAEAMSRLSRASSLS